MDQEEWRVIAEYPDYEVSSHGRVRRLTDSRCARAGHLLKFGIANGRYFQVNLWKEGRFKRLRVNRLVALAFVGPCPSAKHEAAHGDGDSFNNHWKNLRWTTKAENEADKVLHGTSNRGDGHGRRKLTAEQVLEIRRKYSSDRITQHLLAAEYGVGQTQISRIIRNEEWLHLEAS
ncbi:MAG: HNH endonuclease [Paraburkholderia fungorum]|jgi:hypothetical protein|nr:HNH endonuclease [Paraburkholderia fungorum]